VVIKSIIRKIKPVTKSDDATISTAKIKEIKPVDNIVDDLFSNIDNGGAADE